MKSRPTVFLLSAAIFLAPLVCKAENPRVVIRTIFGDIGLELYESEAPITVANFLQYMNDGFYDGLVFHRAIDGFMIQGGSHETLSSWPWLWERTEGLREAIPNESDNGLLNLRGTISMALLPDEPNSGTSGFFINQAHNWWLDGLHTVFGKVLNGMEIVDFIARLPHIDPNLVAGQKDVPIYTDPLGNMYLVYVPETFAAPEGYWFRADLNYDGIVDEQDIAEVCGSWLSEAELGDIEVNGVVDFAEFAQVARRWRWTSVWRRFTAADIDNSGAVNLSDFTLLANDWKKSGLELRGDLNLDEAVNETDLMQLGEDWLKSSQ
jgi:cyclophilin family peptidyl-prolyl cis-trans isomerase